MICNKREHDSPDETLEMRIHVERYQSLPARTSQHFILH
jgi:hypothetical protein